MLRKKTVTLAVAGVLCLITSASLKTATKQIANADFLTPLNSKILPPTNLGADAIINNGKLVQSIHWAAANYATSYSIYEDDVKIAQNITATQYTLDSGLSSAGSYTVTSIDASNTESIPSAPVFSTQTFDTASVPFWVSSATPSAPATPSYTSDWNLGKPRIYLRWPGNSQGDGYNVYRDGVQVAHQLWGLTFIDNDVQPGSTHTYNLTSANILYPTQPEGPHSGTVTVTALTAAPTFQGTPLVITKVIPDDDSAKVFFTTIPGAHDYRVYNLSSQNSAKYAGEYGTGQSADMIKNGFPPLPQPTEESIEMNSLPSGGADLVVEAVDKLGPFQKSDGFTGPGASSGISINGQGDPSNIPNVIARSQAFHVTTRAFTLTAQQVFQDTFKNSQPLLPVDYNKINLAIRQTNGNADGSYNSYLGVEEVENNKWTIRSYIADEKNTRNFIMSNHFMDTLYDGPEDGHNNNSTTIMQPKSTQDISGGKVLHVTMEVDAHDSSRRWTGIMVGAANDPLIHGDPDKTTPGHSTVSGNLLVWDVNEGNSNLSLIQPDPTDPSKTFSTDLFQVIDYSDLGSMKRDIYATVFGHVPSANGTQLNLDNRSRYDLYLSSNHYRIVETEPDGSTQLVRDRDFPAGVTLPFTNTQTYFFHQLYHTGNDRPEQQGDPNSEYWVNYRPFSDERHWDNMGAEVLNSLADVPSSSSLALPSESPNFSGVIPTPSVFTCASMDLNGDGKITLTDVVLAIHAYNGSPNAAALALWPPAGNPGLQGLIKIILAYNGKCT